ncbi:uncharacterized protein LOC111333714 [Stylophora pistillata]|uniref:uncharacterized protein LOC111333714 n=1 Tax=Stylophora pistillata TaxID=50429 RepID=UPI000C0440EB|nr:uncharacterized protein LOC111333714 [Stylophora pistillata]
MATSSPSPLASSVEKTNGAKLSRLLIDGGTTVLRNVFDRYHAPTSLASNLNSHFKTLCTLLRRNILKRPQWEKLFPPSGAAPDSRLFDITLLFLLLTEICGLAPPSSGWHSKPPSSDNSFEANLVRIKFYRNELYGHVKSTSVDESTFNNLWQEISSVLVALGLNNAEIDRLKDEQCGEQEYIDALLHWADSEEDVKSQLGDIRRNQIETQGILSKVVQTQHDCGKVLEENKSKLHELEESQAKTCEVVQERHETLKTDFQEFKRQLEQLEKKQQRERSDEILKNLMKAEFKGEIEHHAEKFQEGTREWIFRQVEEWLDERNCPNRVMVLSGNAGMGKSVISAVLCKRMQEMGRLSGSHFCQHNNVRYRKPQLMLQSLAFHLTHTLPEYKEALVNQLSRNLGLELNTMGVEELFSLLFREPLSNVSDPESSILIVIDGLDESEYQGRNELLNMVAKQFCKLPRWIRFFVTTRPEINISDSLKHLEPIQIDENQEENSRDIKHFFQMSLGFQIEEERKVAFLKKLVDKSEGVFLYAYFLVNFMNENASVLTLDQLESILPLGIASVYLSNFKRLENDLCKELKIEEEEVLRFVSALSASREPLPIEFASRILVPGDISLVVRRRVVKAIACVSSLLPVRDGRLHFFHKSIKDWLTSTPGYGEHDFTVDERVGHAILFRLCSTELECLKQKGLFNLKFSKMEEYALQHCIQHTIDSKELSEMSASCKLEEFINSYVIDLGIIYAKFCVNTVTPTTDLLAVRKHFQRTVLDERSCFLLDALWKVLKKHLYILKDHPHLLFQCIVNGGCPKELTSRAEQILESEKTIPYMKLLFEEDEEERSDADQTRFQCSDKVVCFDVSPEKDYMVCECRDGEIYLWSLETGNLLWIRRALRLKDFYFGRPFDCGYRQVGRCLSFFNSVVFHPNGSWILPGTLANVYDLRGDKIDLFPNTKCTFSHCVFSEDKTIMVTDCPEEPKQIAVWSMQNGDEVNRIEWTEPIASFTISPDGRLIAISSYDGPCSTGSIYIIDAENRRRLDLIKPFNDFDVCGLMHFTSDSTTLACGLISLNSAILEISWEFMFTRRPRFYLLTLTGLVDQSTSSESNEIACKSGTFVLWPTESHLTREDDYLEQKLTSCWVRGLPKVFPFLLTGTYIRLTDNIVLIGSPSYNYLATVNTNVLDNAAIPCSYDGELSEFDLSNRDGRVMKVEMSVAGDAIYSIILPYWKPHLTQVTVFRMTSLKILAKKIFPRMVSLIPMKDGIIISLEERKPELWNFELSEFIRFLPTLTGNEELVPISQEVVACRRKQNIVALNYSCRSSIDILELDDRSASSIPFPFSLFESRTDIFYSENKDYHCEVGLEPMVLRFLNVSNGELASSFTILGPGDAYIDAVSFNSQGQILVCTFETIPAEHTFWEDELITATFWNYDTIVWRKSTVCRDQLPRPQFVFSPRDDVVASWNFLEGGFGLHILDADFGEITKTFLKDRCDIADSKFVNEESLLVCFVHDTFLRLFNVRTGNLVSVLDLGERPVCIGACVESSLVAIGLENRMKFLHFRLPKREVATKKKSEKC